MPVGTKHKLGSVGILILGLISLFALFVAFTVVPALAKESGMSETAITYIVAGLGLVIAFGSTFAARALSKKE